MKTLIDARLAACVATMLCVVAFLFGSGVTSVRFVHAIGDLEPFPEASSDKPNLRGMILIEKATFQMGTDALEIPAIAEKFGIKAHPEIIQSEIPLHRVRISSFYIDKYEVTNNEFQQFLKHNPKWSPDKISKSLDNGNYLKNWTNDKFPEAKAKHPVVNLNWYASVAYCQSQHKRLPTEAEWEYAARGGVSDVLFPWGSEPVDAKRANYSGSGLKATAPVGSYPANGFGVFDMAGNVWEFMGDEWQPYTAAPQTNPVAGGNLFLDKSFTAVTTRRVIRGGSWGGTPLNLRVTYRDSHPPTGSRDFVGFRCALSARK